MTKKEVTIERTFSSSGSRTASSSHAPSLTSTEFSSTAAAHSALSQTGAASDFDYFGGYSSETIIMVYKITNKPSSRMNNFAAIIV